MEQLALSVCLFVDSNKYLKLFGLTSGQPLLEALEEQKDHLFVSEQVAHEGHGGPKSCKSGMRFNRAWRHLTAV